MARPTWKEYFFQIADATAARSTCDRAHVGTVLVRNNRIIATGYNGSVPKQPHCDDVGHLLVNGHCLRCVHSETSALLSAAKAGISTDGATCYISHFPCFACFKALLCAGISHIHYKTEYLNGLSKPIYDAIVACRGQVSITDMNGMDFFHYSPTFEGDVLKKLELAGAV